MIIPDSVLIQLAAEAGFGGNQRNTLLTKLKLFAAKVAEYALHRAQGGDS